MRFLIIGLGSMGKRRIRNLRHLGFTDFVGFDPEPSRREQVEALGVPTVSTFTDAIAAGADAWVISTPPDAHTEYAVAAVRHGRPCFIEASVIADGLEALGRSAAAAGTLVAPSCTMRFHPAIRRIEEILAAGKIGRILTFNHHFGEHLSRWHPWENYNSFYVSKKLTGGCREIVPFELVWLTGLCGAVTDVTAMIGRLGSYESDIDDVYQMLLTFESGVIGHLQVDVLQLGGYRQSRFVCSNGVIAWDWDTHVVRAYTREDGWTDYPERLRDDSPEGFYIDEMEAFVRAVRGEAAWPHPLAQDRAILGVLTCAEQSAVSGQHVACIAAGPQ